jgi:HPt (histidine-containing phosphotransfer) domain-containing protein
MPAVKRRYFILIFIVVSLLTGWSVRLHLATFIITSLLQQAGLEDVTVSIEHQNLKQTQLSRLSFTLPDKTGRISMDAQDITLSYLSDELLRGHIDRLDINSLSFNYARLSNPPTVDIEKQQPALQLQEILGTLKTTLATALDKYVFFNQLVIHHITLNGEVFSVLDGKPLSLISSNDEGVLHAELTLLASTTEGTVINTATNTASNLPQLVITRLDKDGLELEIRPAQDAGKLPAKIQLTLQQTELRGRYQLSPQGMQSWLQAAVGKKNLPAINIKSSELNGTVSLNFKNRDRVFATVTSSAKYLSYDTYNTENIVLDIRLAYSAHATSHNLKLLDGSYLSADKISSDVTNFSNSRIKLAGELSSTDDQWKYQGKLSSKLLSASYQSQQLQLADIDAAIYADISTNAQQLQVKGKVSPGTLPGQFSFVLAHDLASGAGSVSLAPIAAIDLSAEDDKLSKLLTPWPYPFDIYTGRIKLKAQSTWSNDKEARLSADINVEDAGGDVNTILFSGLSFDHQLKILPVLKSAQSSEIKLNTLDSGVTISNIKLQLAATTSSQGSLPRMLVRQTQGEILGGTFIADDMVYDPNLSKNSVLIKVSDIDLAEVVKTQQLESITATGRLDGRLPVEITKDGINITDGDLTNQIRGGTIRYIPKNGTGQLKQNPITGLALDALKDFRYSVLQAHVNYQPDGALTINLEMKGLSPEVDKKRPVVLNINTEQNLVSLLKSLRYAQGVSDNIDDQVRQMYERSQNP